MTPTSNSTSSSKGRRRSSTSSKSSTIDLPSAFSRQPPKLQTNLAALVQEAVIKFVGVIDASGIVGKLEKVKGILQGPLKICRDKLELLQSNEASTVLADIEPDYPSRLVENVRDIFNEEVETAKSHLEEIDAGLSELTTLLSNVALKLEGTRNHEGLISLLVLQSFGDCRSVLTYLSLRNNILKTYLTIPFEDPVKSLESLNSSAGEDDFCYILAKLNASIQLSSFLG